MKTKMVGLVLGLVAVAAIAFAVVYWPEPVSESGASAPHYEARGLVTQVVDGDTIIVWLTWVDESIEDVEAGVENSVRFSGGIDAPELVENGGAEAGNFVIGLCPLWTEVFLDLDDGATGGTGSYRDKYGRLLAVIYVEQDGKWINVNAEELRWGMEAYPLNDWLEYISYDSDFDPYEWLADNYPYVCG